KNKRAVNLRRRTETRPSARHSRDVGITNQSSDPEVVHLRAAARASFNDESPGDFEAGSSNDGHTLEIRVRDLYRNDPADFKIRRNQEVRGGNGARNIEEAVWIRGAGGSTQIRLEGTRYRRDRSLREGLAIGTVEGSATNMMRGDDAGSNGDVHASNGGARRNVDTRRSLCF